MSAPVLHSCLDSAHRALGAKMTPFGGWDMPLQYAGVLDEHRACRSGGVVFDVSHLGSVVVKGSGAFDALQGLLTNDLAKITPGHAQYTHLLDARDAHVVDDIIVWWVSAEYFLVIPNASNTGPALSALGEAAEAAGHSEVEDVTQTRALLAVQGPQSRKCLAQVAPAAAGVAHFGVLGFTFDGVNCLVGGTGYTGEDGVELFVPKAAAPKMFEALLATGLQPAGLGARDTLRLEMGYPLHGHELGPGITPLQAGLSWVVGWDKPEFRGKAALTAERERGVARRLRGIVMDGRQAPRGGYLVYSGDALVGEPIGEVTSGNFSPTLERGIALAFLAPEAPYGASITVDVRGRPAAGTVTRPPFLQN